MDFMNLHKKADVARLKAGSLLIAEPFLNDPNFVRSVIFISEYSEEGAIGFVLNRPTDFKLNDLLPDLYTTELSVNQGGPVQLDTLHMLHRIPGLLGGNEVSPGIYWGGSYEALQDIISGKQYDGDDLKLFLGYSGWSPGQLEEEINEGSWLIADASEDILFEPNAKKIWTNAIHTLEREYHVLANMPLNPQWN